MLAALLAQDRQEIFFRKIKAGVRRNRLEDHAGDLVFIFGERFSHEIDVVEGKRNCQIGKRFWNAGAVGLAMC